MIKPALVSAYPTHAEAETALTHHLRRPCRLKLTDNRQRMMSLVQRADAVELRLQRIFLVADKGLWREIFAFCTGQTYDRRALQQFFQQQVQPRPVRTLPAPLNPIGQHHHLGQLADEVARSYFDRPNRFEIGWGRRVGRRSVKSIRLGSFQPQTQQIRIHPWLDQSRVPQFFVAFVIYHEMLHAELGSDRRHGRHYWHTAEFRQREALFSDYAAAVEWQKSFFTTVSHPSFWRSV